MDHGHMGHGGMGHGDMDMDMDMCNMNMLFTWDTTNLCIVFRWWRVRGTASLLLSLAGVVALTAGYELVREGARRYEAQAAQRRSDGGTATAHDESSSLLSAGRTARGGTAAEAARREKVIKGLLYAVQVFYSFFVMLLFMTYNGWVMLAVAVGAFIGYLVFGQSSPTKSVACH